MIISIDGVAGAGKTTLAKFIFEEFSSRSTVFIIHMDDLYEGWRHSLGPTLSEKLKNIAQAHNSGEAISISAYDWDNSRPGSNFTVPNVETLIIEGVGSGQRAIREFVDTKIWIELEPIVGLRRVLQRDGEQIESEMLLFLQEQARHFMEEGTREAADFHLNGLN